MSATIKLGKGYAEFEEDPAIGGDRSETLTMIQIGVITALSIFSQNGKRLTSAARLPSAAPGKQTKE